MSAPSGSSTEGTGAQSSDVAMANPGNLPIENIPVIDISTPPDSEKSRSLRERRQLPPLQNAVVPSHVGFNHRGFVPQAPREGGSQTRQLNQMNVHNTFQHNVHVDNPQMNFLEHNVHLHAHDPSVTSLVEATAELRHREVLAQAEAQAEAIHIAKTEELKEALRVREGIESQRALDAVKLKHEEVNRMGIQYRENLKHEAQEHVRLQQAQMHEKVQAYQRVIDANHRQSLSTKEHEIMELKRQAEEEKRLQNERIAQLEQMVQMQAQQNMKLQSMVDSYFAQARPAPIVESGTATMPTRTVEESETFFRPTAKNAPAPRAPPTHATSSDWFHTSSIPLPPDSDPDLERDGIEIVYMDPELRDRPVRVKREPGTIGISTERRHPEGRAKPIFGDNNDAGRSPAPTHPYSPTEAALLEPDGYVPDDEGNGDGEDPPDGDEGPGGPGGGPPNPPNPPNGNGDKPKPRNAKDNKPKNNPGAPDGGDGGGGDGSDGEDSDQKFRRKLMKFLGETWIPSRMTSLRLKKPIQSRSLHFHLLKHIGIGESRPVKR